MEPESGVTALALPALDPENSLACPSHAFPSYKLGQVGSAEVWFLEV